MGETVKKAAYDESKIKTLSSLEHIRLRSGMYIGRTGDGALYDDGIYVLLKEVVDNAVDEFIMGHGARVTVGIKDGNVSIRDYGRGIPLGKIVDCVSRINTGAKYNDDVFQFSVGLNGVGLKAVNALSSAFLVRSFRAGRYTDARFVCGVLKGETKKGSAPKEPDGTLVEFTPDEKIFGKYAFQDEHVIRRLKFYAYLNAGFKLDYNGHIVEAKNGLLDLISHESQFEKVYPPFHYRDKMLEITFTHTNRFSEQYFSFVNGQYTNDGGSHLSAFKEGLLKGINEYSKKKFTGDDVREGIVGAVSIRIKEPIFESQTKNKLGNTEIRAPLVSSIKDIVVDLLHKNRKQADRLIEKVEDTQKLRNELMSIKKIARERSKTVSIRIPQLKDCKKHFKLEKGEGLDTEIFITEGQSAAGSLVSCRDAMRQAIFTLKGKPLNVCNLNRDAMYKNTELYNLMCALNIEDNPEQVRYNKVILATDADVDGLHIRNLMITLFLRFFEGMVQNGHLYILETPLFRVRNKKQTIYCYSETERDSALKDIGRGSEITRFKGLGEISPGEFKAFIGADMRLTPVSVKGEDSIHEVINFYMGTNTQERRQYIMDNLIIDEEALV